MAHMVNMKIVVVGIIAIIIIAVVVAAGFRTVDAGNRGVKLTYGKPDMNELGEGMHIVTPFVDSVVQLSVQTLKVEEQASAASKDLQDVSTTVAVNFRLQPDQVAEIYQGLGTSYPSKVITPAIQEIVKQITAKYTASDLISKRADVKSQIETQIRERLVKYGINVEAVSITNFAFSKSFSAAIEAKVTEQQKVEQARNQLQRIEVEAQQKIAQAHGEANSTVARAEGESRAIKVIQEQIAQSPEYIEYQKVTKWNGILPQYMGSGDPIITIPGNVTRR